MAEGTSKNNQLKINRTYKYRLYPTVKQQKIIDQQLHLLRKIYNKFLKQRIDLYKKKGVKLAYKHQQKQLPLIKSNKRVLGKMARKCNIRINSKL